MTERGAWFHGLNYQSDCSPPKPPHTSVDTHTQKTGDKLNNRLISCFGRPVGYWYCQQMRWMECKGWHWPEVWYTLQRQTLFDRKAVVGMVTRHNSTRVLASVTAEMEITGIKAGEIQTHRLSLLPKEHTLYSKPQREAEQTCTRLHFLWNSLSADRSSRSSRQDFIQLTTL